jgi:hypothetical protein
MLSIIFSVLGKIPKSLYWLVAGALLLAATAWYSQSQGHARGYSKAEAKYTAVLNKLEADSHKLKADLAKKNAEITQDVIIEYVDREKLIYKNKVVYRDIIKEVMVPSQCPMTNAWISVHDAAATQTQPNIGQDANEYSKYSDVDALSGVVDNYATCYQIRNQLIALQDWVKRNDEQLNGDKNE